jgi:uncharacterized membrane protein
MADRRSTRKAGAGEPQGLFRWIERLLIDGAMIVLPIGAIVLLVLAIVRKLEDAADPLSSRYIHPVVVALALLVILCLLVGLLVRSGVGKWVRRTLQNTVFDKIPGYRLAMAVTGDGFLSEAGGRAIRPALASIEDGECPVFVIDEFADGRLLVFVPGSPAPMSGALYIFTPDRVRVLDTPTLPFLKAVSSWGLGLKEILDAAEKKASGRRA